jgi:hypothetical protein
MKENKILSLHNVVSSIIEGLFELLFQMSYPSEFDSFSSCQSCEFEERYDQQRLVTCAYQSNIQIIGSYFLFIHYRLEQVTSHHRRKVKRNRYFIIRLATDYSLGDLKQPSTIIQD